MVNYNITRLEDSERLVVIGSEPFTYTVIPLTYFNPSTVLTEGMLVDRNATTQEAEAAVTATSYVTYLTIERSDSVTCYDNVIDSFGDGTESPIPAGGVSALIGNGTLVGVDKTLWSSATAPVIDYHVVVSGVTPGLLLACDPAGLAGLVSFGVIVAETPKKWWFIYNSVGVIY